MTYTAETWPIACAMLPFGGLDSAGGPIQDADPDEWNRQLWEVADLGFTEIDPTDVWVRVADLQDSRRKDFKAVLAENNLTVPAISTSRKSVIDAARGDEHLAYGHRLIDAAADLGSTVVSFGFFQDLTPEQLKATWFWHVDGYSDPDDADVRAKAVARTRELAEHAASVGIEISLEMYEDTYVGTADASVAFLKEVDHPACGMNPDVGNLVRLHRPLAPVMEQFEKLLPYTNFWHVKNYSRDVSVDTGAYATFPVPLSMGYINYRQAIARALELGFRGPFLTEHYGSDSLFNCAQNREYLRTVLRAKLH